MQCGNVCICDLYLRAVAWIDVSEVYVLRIKYKYVNML